MQNGFKRVFKHSRSTFKRRYERLTLPSGGSKPVEAVVDGSRAEVGDGLQMLLLLLLLLLLRRLLLHASRLQLNQKLTLVGFDVAVVERLKRIGQKRDVFAVLRVLRERATPHVQRLIVGVSLSFTHAVHPPHFTIDCVEVQLRCFRIKT